MDSEGGANLEVIKRSVALSGTDVAVAENTLDDLHGLAIADQLGAPGVAQLVEGVSKFEVAAGVLDEAEVGTELRPLVLGSGIGDLGATVGAEERDVGRVVLHFLEERTQAAERTGRGRGAKEGDAFTAILGLANAEALMTDREVDVAELESKDLTDAHASFSDDRED